MLSEIDRTKTFVLIKSFPDHSFHEAPIIFRLESRNEKNISYAWKLDYPKFYHFYACLSLSLSAAVIDKREKELNFRFSRLTKGFSFQWRISGFGKKLCQMLSRRKQ